MSQLNLDNCRKVVQTLVTEKVKSELNVIMDRLQIEVNVMTEELSYKLKERLARVSIRSSEDTELDSDDRMDTVANIWPEDGISSPSYSANTIEPEVNHFG